MSSVALVEKEIGRFGGCGFGTSVSSRVVHAVPFLVRVVEDLGSVVSELGLPKVVYYSLQSVRSVVGVNGLS